MDAEEQQTIPGTIIALFLFAVMLVGSGIYAFLRFSGMDSDIPFFQDITSRSAESTEDQAVGSDENKPAQATDPSREEGDINDDGEINYLDMQLISGSLGCSQDEECWQKTIGKTVTGHNPIYVFDLDLDGNGVIDVGDEGVVENGGN